MNIEKEKRAIDNNVEYNINPKGGIVLNDDNDSSRRFVELCYRTTSTMVNPIVDWSDQDVWDFLKHYGCRSNPLYECGFKRIGCVGCPLGGSASMKREFLRYPKYRENYIRAFDRMIENRKQSGLPTVWENGVQVMRWWVGDNPDQLDINDLFDDFEF